MEVRAMKTETEYLQRYTHCPSCDSDQIEGKSINVDANYAYQEISCVACEASWVDCYTLTGYELIEEGEKTS